MRLLSVIKQDSENVLAGALGGAILLGVLVAWAPRYWPAAVLHSAILLVTVVWLFFGRSFSIYPKAGFVIVLSLWGWLQLFVFGTASFSATKAAAVEWSFAGITFWLASNLFRNKRALSFFLGIVLWGTVVTSLLGVLQMYSSPQEVFWYFPAQPFAVGTFLSKNQFAALIEFAGSIALYWIFLRPNKRRAGQFALVSLFGCSVASGSRAGVFLLIAECIGATVIAYRAKAVTLRTSYLFIAVTFLALGVSAFLFGNQIAWEHLKNVQPDEIRQELLKSTVQMMKKEPWSGYGLRTWALIYPQYATFDIGRFANAAHNDWAQWFSEGGLVFAGSMLGLVLWLAKPALTTVWGLGLISIMVHSWVDYPLREPVLAILWFSMAGALSAQARRHNQPRAGQSRFKQSSA